MRLLAFVFLLLAVTTEGDKFFTDDELSEFAKELTPANTKHAPTGLLKSSTNG